jgi:hypothetical protein
MHWVVWILNELQYLKWLSEKLGISQAEEWASISYMDIKALKGAQALLLQGGKFNLISQLVPQPTNRHSSRACEQQHMTRMVKQLFPNMVVKTQYKCTEAYFVHSHAKMEFDVFVPEISLALEYQGQQHFLSDDVIQRDSEKVNACQQLGITLVTVPYWWDRTKDSLAATIHLARPDLLLTYGTCPAIPTEPPLKLRQRRFVAPLSLTDG